MLPPRDDGPARCGVGRELACSTGLPCMSEPMVLRRLEDWLRLRAADHPGPAATLLVPVPAASMQRGQKYLFFSHQIYSASLGTEQA